MNNINFSAQPAYVMDCPVCNERYVGGHHNKDQKTAQWVNLHGDWHSKGNKDVPPMHIRPLFLL